jgi:oxygen-independent coproporphyrinogen-3 oxidase
LAGIEHISIDLIYGIPGQTLAVWQASVRRAIDSGAEHLSGYALSFERGTPLWRRLRAGQVQPVDEQLQKDCYHSAIALAAEAGLEHYEISNFARPGWRCRHNLTYWRNEPYLGVGPAAASYVGGVRWRNSPDLGRYLQALQGGRPAPATREHLTGPRAMAETIMLGLRLVDGLDRAAFACRYGQDILAAFPRTISRYAELSALIVTDRSVCLDPAAFFVADTILADFLAEADLPGADGGD